MFNNSIKFIRRYYLIISFLFIGIFLIVLNNKINQNEITNYKKVFHNKLFNEEFYFTGKIISFTEIERGHGFVCVRKLKTNKPSGYEFNINKNFIASVGDSTIKYLGTISIPNSSSKKIKIGDTVKYNHEYNRKILIYRNSELIFERDAFIYKVHYNKEHYRIKCE